MNIVALVAAFLLIVTASVVTAGAVAPTSCAPLIWKAPFSWNGGDLVSKTYNASECSRLVIRTDLHSCELNKPLTKCQKDDQCPKGQMCNLSMFPAMCVTCDTDHTTHSSYSVADVILNVTEAMLHGRFWTVDQFYNHTGVDLILTLERWVWSPNMKALLHDLVLQHRMTWDSEGDSDMFNTRTEAFQFFNASHVIHRWAEARRDALDSGEIDLSGAAGEQYLPVAS